MRIALAVAGSRGDVYPVLALGRELTGAGHEVHVCATEDFREETVTAGLSYRPVGSSVRALLDRNATAIGAGPRETLRACLNELQTMIDDHFAALPGAIEDADLVIGAGVQIAGPSVAESQGKPYRLLAYCPTLLPSREYPPFMIPWQRAPHFANRLLWLLARHGFGALLRRPVDRHRRKLGLEPLRDVYAHFVSEHPILAVDPGLVRVPADVPYRVQQVRCLHPFEPGPLPEKLSVFLDSGPPPVYLGFGSMPDAAPGETTRLMLEAVEQAGVRAVIGGGWAGLGQGPLPESVTTVSEVSHPALFPRCSAVVHHGGAGTTTTAARAGVPQVLVPHLLDQFYYAHRLWQLGVAPASIERRALGARSLAGALVALADNDFVAERARALGQDLRRELEAPFDPGVLLPS